MFSSPSIFSARLLRLLGVLAAAAFIATTLHTFDGLGTAHLHSRTRVQISLWSSTSAGTQPPQNHQPHAGQASAAVHASRPASSSPSSSSSKQQQRAQQQQQQQQSPPPPPQTKQGSASLQQQQQQQQQPAEDCTRGLAQNAHVDPTLVELQDDLEEEDFAPSGLPPQAHGAADVTNAAAGYEDPLSEQESVEDALLPSVLLTREEKGRIAEHLQDVIEDYQGEYVQYMNQHVYGYAPEEERLDATYVEQFYKEPLSSPHAHKCRGHEPGLVRVKGESDRLYCFGTTTREGERVCDVEHHDYTKLADAKRGYDVYELYEKKFAHKPFFHTSEWTLGTRGGKLAGSDNNAKPSRDTITAMSQGSWNRLEHLQKLVKIWQGPVSFALLLDSPDQLDQLESILAENEDMRRHVDLHVSWRLGHKMDDPDAFYPINMLRNMALLPIKSGYAFVIDVDNIPNARMSKYSAWTEKAEEAVKPHAKIQSCPGLTAFVPPAVEMSAERLARMYRANERAGAKPLTLSKRKLVEGFYDGTVQPMHVYFGPAYVPTNHFAWAKSNSVDPLPYLTRFEPYYIARVPLPLFNESFVNRGGNYAQQVYEMHAAGYNFFRLPTAFIVDIPHARAEKHSAPTPAASASSEPVGRRTPDSASSSSNNNNNNQGGAIVTENHTKQAVHDENFIANLWVSFSDWVSHRYGHHMPSPKVTDPNFRKYRRSQEKVTNAMWHLLGTTEAPEQQASETQ